MVYHMYQSNYGTIQICIEGDYIVNMTMKELDFKSVSFIEQINKSSLKNEIMILKEVTAQLDDYFTGKIHSFNLPIKLEGSDFVKRVYKAVLSTEYGKTYSYKDIATLAGSPRAYRAVGTAMKNNPFAMVIPCHRVIKSNGEYGRYFNNDNLKQTLIEFENNLV